VNEAQLTVLALAVTSLVVVGLVFVTRDRRPRPPKPKTKSELELFRETFVDDPEVVLIDDWFSFASRDGRFTVNHRNIGDSRIWEVRGPTLRVKGRTTWRCAPEGMLSALFDIAGLGDVKTGDAGFDARVMLTGSDRDVVRALACHPEVRRAIERLINGLPYLIGAEVDWQGSLQVRFHRSDMTPDVARAVVRSVRQLADALDAAADVEPLPPPLPEEVGSVSSSSGAPVGFGAR
jgi:hypothetical protein